MTFCSICGRDSQNGTGYCRYHQDALDDLRASYDAWKKATGVSWEEYIESLCQLDEIGRWVFEVADQIRSGDGPSTTT